jgi:gas vesicle protein
MLDTLAKTAVVSTAITLVRRLQGKNESTIIGSIGLIAAGIIIGGGAALLLTPKSGAELRGDVAKRARQLKSGAQERFTRAKEAALAETH